MSDINQNVNINVNANTQDAGQEISKLENNIKTLDGAINLVGGSVEVLAGSLALTGAVTEEQAERFEAAAVGAIALADGSKRALEGFKILATETKVFTGLQRVLNRVLNANPIFLIAGAVAAVGAAYIAFRNSQRETADVVEDTNEQLQDQIDLLNETANIGAGTKLKQLEASAKAQNITVKEAIELERQRAKEVLERRNREILALETQVEENKRTNRVDQEALELQLEKAKAFKNNAQAALDLLDAVEALQAKEKEGDKDSKDREERERRRREREIADEQAAFEQFERNYNKRKALEDKEFEERMARDRERYKSAINTANQINQTEQKILDARLEIGQIGVEAFQQGLEAIFGESKGLAKAQVYIDAAQAAVGIIRKGTDPRNAEALVFPNAWIAANLAFLAATTAASIQSINSANAEGGGGTSPTNYGGPQPAGGAGGAVSGLPQLPGSRSGVTNLNAVVLSGDVTSAQAQDAAIRNRRRFG